MIRLYYSEDFQFPISKGKESIEASLGKMRRHACFFPACQVDGGPPSLTGAVLCILAIGVKVSLARDAH